MNTRCLVSKHTDKQIVKSTSVSLFIVWMTHRITHHFYDIWWIFWRCLKTKNPSNDIIWRVLLTFCFDFAEWTGLEPATPCVTGMYSNQLNYHSFALRVCKYELFSGDVQRKIQFENYFIITGCVRERNNTIVIKQKCQ